MFGLSFGAGQVPVLLVQVVDDVVGLGTAQQTGVVFAVHQGDTHDLVLQVLQDLDQLEEGGLLGEEGDGGVHDVSRPFLVHLGGEQLGEEGQVLEVENDVVDGNGEGLADEVGGADSY